MAAPEGSQAGGQALRPDSGLQLQIGQFADVVGGRIAVLDRHRRERSPAGGEDLDIQMGIGGKVLEHRHDPHGVEAGDQRLLLRSIAEGGVLGGVDEDRAADGGIDAEVLAGRLAGQDQAVGRLHRGVGVPRQHRIGHDLEEVRRDPDRGLRGGDIALLQERPTGAEPRDVGHLKELQLQGTGQHPAGEDHRPRLLAGQRRVGLQAIGPLVARQEPLEGGLLAQIQADHDGGGEADRQAHHGHPGVEPVAGEVVQAGREIIAEHDPLPLAYS